ncbi:alanine racemase [Aquimarina sp. U1-2]|uniref:alanine racemase n=1 Tax=Aquimarina sp. U1-2 TaxID=2823141 RepID=UPI001AEC9504|nr:alanine racemase [Aquimarina sp. U1-2]MBP2833263.1 alanine racemase [Aquimarina sp. U1-2]
MSIPRIDINLSKIAHNTKILSSIFQSKGIDVIAVTKGVCADPHIANILVKSGIKILADSRISNIKKMRIAGVKANFLLIRTPMISQTESVVLDTDMSLNSELSVIKKLSEYAILHRKIHKIILMIELGDLREGILPSQLENTIKKVLTLKGIKLEGIGTNLACFSGVKPTAEKMDILSSIANSIEKKFNIKLSIISGGNSANYNWFNTTKDLGKINNLRLGESIFLGYEPLTGKPIPKLYQDAFMLTAEVIELKNKSSVPDGEIGLNAFGNKPNFKDQGMIKRAILAMGVQDVMVTGLTPKLDIEILGAGGDHIIINAKKEDLKVGDEVSFTLKYGALVTAMNSSYIFKNIKTPITAKEYCTIVEEKDRLHKKKTSMMTVKENNSPLISLQDSGFNLIFEKSIQKNYRYLVRKEVYEKIGRISRLLDNQGKKLIIRSAWRSFEHQQKLWNQKVSFLKKKYPKKTVEEINEIVSNFIAPRVQSTHATGGAVDTLIYDLRKKCVLDFGTNDGLHIDLNEKCYPKHPGISQEAKKNRKFLMELFENEDFVCDHKEYWHFDYGNIGWAVEKNKKYAHYGIIEESYVQSTVFKYPDKTPFYL